MAFKKIVFFFFFLFISNVVQAQGWYRNPITTDFGCADPGLFMDPAVSGRFLLSCTGGRFYLRQSDDLLNWKGTGKTLVDPGPVDSWAREGRSWAPEVTRIDSRLVAYYTQNSKAKSGAIGVSWTSNLYRNGFSPARRTPLLANSSVGGVIDPSYFKDPATGKHYLLYKIDGNSQRKNTHIRIDELNSSGNALLGRPRTLKSGGNSLKTLVEGQDLIKRGRYYYLFYSHGSYIDSYQVRVARATNVLGPYTGDRTILRARSNNPIFRAPGHGKVVHVPGKDLYFYHAYDNRKKNNVRYPMIDEIHWKDGWPLINNGFPSFIGQYAPMVPHSYFQKVTMRWNAPNLKNPNYSMDLIYAGGTKANACLNARIIGSRQSIDFDGYCDSANKIFRRPKTKMKFRICAAENGDWTSKNRKVQCTGYKNIDNRVSYVRF